MRAFLWVNFVLFLLALGLKPFHFMQDYPRVVEHSRMGDYVDFVVLAALSAWVGVMLFNK